MSQGMMRQTWRWFGPGDKVSLAMARQAGVEGIVTALHDMPPGTVWQKGMIEERQRLVREAGLEWEVVESLPVSEDIKLRKDPWREHVGNYVESLENLASCGIEVVCYNFMPVLDWTRTDLAWKVGHGGTAMRFDLVDFAVFDIHLLKRDGSGQDYRPEVVETASRRAHELDEESSARLVNNVLCGLPGSAESWTLEKVRRQLSLYEGVDAETLRANQQSWLEEVVPAAERLGLRLCCHPDDPPFLLLGLPRVMSTEEDFRRLVEAVPSPANGITFCTGSLGARPDNDLPGFVERLGDCIHFVHLRNVTRDTDDIPCGFFEDEHLSGGTDMVAVIASLLAEQGRRREEGASNWQLPMRPDHGQDILDDLTRDAQPGYPAIGRLKGLAELRGVMRALEA